MSALSVQAVLLAGDRGASRAVRGRSKAFLEVAGKPMVVHVLEALLHTPEVSEVFAVGDTVRLEKALAEFGCLQLAASRGKPVQIVPQRNSLLENVWHSFLRTLPVGPPYSGTSTGHSNHVADTGLCVATVHPILSPAPMTDAVPLDPRNAHGNLLLLGPNADAPKVFRAPQHRFNHISVSRCGTYFVCDTFYDGRLFDDAGQLLHW